MIFAQYSYFLVFYPLNIGTPMRMYQPRLSQQVMQPAPIHIANSNVQNRGIFIICWCVKRLF